VGALLFQNGTAADDHPTSRTHLTTDDSNMPVDQGRLCTPNLVNGFMAKPKFALRRNFLQIAVLGPCRTLRMVEPSEQQKPRSKTAKMGLPSNAPLGNQLSEPDPEQ
jgi:hypothetical protein